MTDAPLLDGIHHLKLPVSDRTPVGWVLSDLEPGADPMLSSR